MRRLSGFRYGGVVRRLRRLGFSYQRDASGSHEIWFNGTTNRAVVIPRHARPIAEGTLRSIRRVGGVDVDEFLNA